MFLSVDAFDVLWVFAMGAEWGKERDQTCIKEQTELGKEKEQKGKRNDGNKMKM